MYSYGIWHENFMVIKFYGLPLNQWMKSLQIIILQKPSFTLGYHAVFGF